MCKKRATLTALDCDLNRYRNSIYFSLLLAFVVAAAAASLRNAISLYYTQLLGRKVKLRKVFVCVCEACVEVNAKIS